MIENFYMFRAFANFRQSSLDGLTSGRGTSFSSGGLFGGSSSRPRPSSSESNLRKLTMGDAITRPGSALGLLQGNGKYYYLFPKGIVIIFTHKTFSSTFCPFA